MKGGRFAAGVLALSLSGAMPGGAFPRETGPERVVRIAELEIDPARVEEYQRCLREEIEASIRAEPGVLKLYAVAVKGHPEQVRLFEMYASAEAYQAHLRSPHFLKYKEQTAGMVKSLRLLETEPILLGSKPD
ncbi:antibiotic biosynthesis monooxygenase [Acidobacteria bacterium AB60]|nr:antibiotic biosynthesis monooxygenase [Acidobacteria bacterium AB60]